MAYIILAMKSPESSSTREVVGEVSEMSRSDLEKFYNATFQDFNIKACTFLGRRCTVRLSDLILSADLGSVHRHRTTGGPLSSESGLNTYP